MSVSDILVKTLREEHRDREWVDRLLYHWLWCEESWRVWHPMWGRKEGWAPIGEIGWNTGDVITENPTVDNGPFMEALHHKVLHSR